MSAVGPGRASTLRRVRSRIPKAVVAGVTLLLGVVCLGLWRLVGGSESQPFAPGAQPPNSVTVTVDHTYSIAVPGGVSAMRAAGTPVTTSSGGAQSLDLDCDWSTGGAAPQALKTTAESTSTKATEVVATFAAPVSGRIAVTCRHWGTVFVPDADDASGDPSGWFLIAATVLFVVGGAAALSSGWSAAAGRVLA